MASFSAAITRIFDAFFALFAWANPWLGLAAISFVSGAIALVMFRYTSSQRRIRAVKAHIMADLLEIVLYRDEPSVIIRAEGRAFLDSARYLASALIPLACMILPVGLMLVQTDLRYGHRALAVGERAIVAVNFAPGAEPGDAIKISAPRGIVVETPAMRMPAAGEVDWRIRAAAPGSYELRFAAGAASFTKQVIVGARRGRIAALRVGGLGEQLLHPGEPPLPPGGPVASVRVSYPGASLRLFGWRLHWVWPWLVLSLAFGYGLRGPLRVEL